MEGGHGASDFLVQFVELFGGDAGWLFADWCALFYQGLFHQVEGFNIQFFKLHGFLATVTHSDDGKTIACQVCIPYTLTPCATFPALEQIRN